MNASSAALFALTLLALAAPAAAQVPDRPTGAPTGSQFVAQVRSLPAPAREAAILREVTAGNVPDFERAFQRVAFTATDAALRPRRVEVWVLPDYLAIGTDRDFVRMPMTPLTAQRICDALGCSLPTRKIVNEVWKAAAVKLTPQPLPPTAAMTTPDYFLKAEKKIEAQWGARPLGPLTAGDKKDVVISNRLVAHPDRVAIYGWHWPSGQPIQPLSTVHANTYADYSHGVRPVWGYVRIDGRVLALADALKDAALAPCLSDEGVMPSPRVPGVPPPRP
ncbi:MAG TPA: hypothetical protein VHF22_01705 [Planctomycetota bacterium]|nr:hypothetical protein [Planctomycetota bacterium]